MSFTLVHVSDWYKHDDCRNAFRVHIADCAGIRRDLGKDDNNVVMGVFDTVLGAVQTAHNIAKYELFPEAYSTYGWTQTVGVCSCAGGKTAKMAAASEVVA